MLFCLVFACLASAAAARETQNLSKNITNMFDYFFDAECLTTVTPVGGRDPLEDSFAFFDEHLGDLRVDTTLLSMTAFAGLVTLTLSGEVPNPKTRIGTIFFIMWAASQMVQCVLLVFAMVFSIAAYVSLHANYGACIKEWRDGAFPTLHLVVGLTICFQPSIAQRLCALQYALFGLSSASRKEAPGFHRCCKLLQKTCAVLTLLSLGWCCVCWLASGAFIFSAVFLPCLLATIACASVGLLLLYAEGSVFHRVARNITKCRQRVALNKDSENDQVEPTSHESTRHHASWVWDGLPRKPQLVLSNFQGFPSQPLCSLMRRCRGLLSSGWKECLSLVAMTSKAPKLAYFCLLWMSACPMVILGTWVACCIYSGELAASEIGDRIAKGYAFSFQILSSNLQLHWPSFIDLDVLAETPNVAEYFVALLKDFTDYSPTYLLTGSRVVSVLSFFFAALKKFATALNVAVELYNNSSGSKLSIGQEALILEVTTAKASGNHAEYIEKIAMCREGGFTAGVLLSLEIGVQLEDAKDAGFDAKAFLDAGISLDRLAEADFDARELEELGYELRRLHRHGFNAAKLKESGFNIEELKEASCSASEMKDVGFSADDLKRVGFNVGQLKTAGFDLETLKGLNYSPKELESVGYDAHALKASGFTCRQLKGIFHQSALRSSGFDLQCFMDAGFTGAELKYADFSVGELKQAGFKCSDLLRSFGAKELREGGFDSLSLKQAGLDLSRLLEAGCDLRELKYAGIGARELKKGGLVGNCTRFSFADMKSAGFTVEELTDAGFRVGDIVRAQAFDLKEFARAGWDACSFRQAGVGIEALYDAGMPVKNIQTAGYSHLEWKVQMRCPPSWYKSNLGWGPKDFKKAKFTADEARSAGFEGYQLRLQGGYE